MCDDARYHGAKVSWAAEIGGSNAWIGGGRRGDLELAVDLQRPSPLGIQIRKGRRWCKISTAERQIENNNGGTHMKACQEGAMGSKLHAGCLRVDSPISFDNKTRRRIHIAKNLATLPIFFLGFFEENF
ncbi:hypothetical protein GOP47_0016215 [Adiantum capillus-veneris]|uniref:Uncharacterized protein n=1 Tax=Adiantum capillus-veneris TaxID=13818 RepID=A0A9D4ZBU7_ADICA|nr:hypothetical protein GOP47_0016215 [Adiantum capillus-veneris]